MSHHIAHMSNHIAHMSNHMPDHVDPTLSKRFPVGAIGAIVLLALLAALFAFCVSLCGPHRRSYNDLALHRS